MIKHIREAAAQADVLPRYSWCRLPCLMCTAEGKRSRHVLMIFILCMRFWGWNEIFFNDILPSWMKCCIENVVCVLEDLRHSWTRRNRVCVHADTLNILLMLHGIALFFVFTACLRQLVSIIKSAEHIYTTYRKREAIHTLIVRWTHPRYHHRPNYLPKVYRRLILQRRVRHPQDALGLFGSHPSLRFRKDDRRGVSRAWRERDLLAHLRQRTPRTHRLLQEHPILTEDHRLSFVRRFLGASLVLLTRMQQMKTCLSLKQLQV